ncbi:LuxR C-terminal-related transcriptional regulator [Dyadobacter subterraneus]|uniref:Response regulator transcription factor n=1 Tax=Dyadobacter subterraneus TaxID=2773304 RepID=A0ABR9W8M2_9BACT|nr:response regulator transcription factor [Dyadobacter subterraneus]MBE9460579.1 response regulator transcription factor [Dyadobacter subterraneus]
MKTIAVIDKHPIVRAGLEIFIKNNFSKISIEEFESFYHFNKVCDKTPDLFIVGNMIELPSKQCEFIIKLKEKNSAAKVIIYDENPDVFKVLLFFKSGVNGYLSKGSDISDLLECILDVQNGKNYVSNDVLELLLPKWVSTAQDPSDRNQIKLTPREFEIANFLISGFTVEKISKEIQRQATTIYAIKKKLFNKLNISNLVDLKDALENPQVVRLFKSQELS